METVFRSILNVKKKGVPTIAEKELVKNYKIFLSSGVNCEDPSYIRMYEWIEAHFREFKEIPSLELLYEKAQKEGEETVLVNLKALAPLIPYWGADYKAVLKEVYESQSKDTLRSVVEKTWQIAHSGLKTGKGRQKKELKGIKDAISYFSSGVKPLVQKKGDAQTEGQIVSPHEGAEVRKEYQRRKREPSVGLYTNLLKIDDVFRGVKLGDLFIIAAFVGQGKTTFAVNMTYQGICQGMNGLFVTMEMTYGEMRDMINVLHTGNADWFDHPQYKSMVGEISYSKVRYGELNPEEEAFFDASTKDFGERQISKESDDFGELHIYQPDEHLTPSRFEMELYNYKSDLESRGKSLDFVVLDYVGLMIQDKDSRYGDFNTDLNNIIKRLKGITINFNDGHGVRIITPFQVNRDGWKEACKNDGVYKLTALSNANEAERSADGVVTLFMTEEMKRGGRVKFGCLKHRDGEDFMPFEGNIKFKTRQVKDFKIEKSDLSDSSIPINPVGGAPEVEGVPNDIPGLD